MTLQKNIQLCLQSQQKAKAITVDQSMVLTCNAYTLTGHRHFLGAAMRTPQFCYEWSCTTGLSKPRKEYSMHAMTCICLSSTITCYNLLVISTQCPLILRIQMTLSLVTKLLLCYGKTILFIFSKGCMVRTANIRMWKSLKHLVYSSGL